MLSLRSSAVMRFVVSLSFSGLPALAAAQNAGSIISGTVQDSSGGVLPGASVKITSEATNTSSDIITSADGTYATEPLVPGAYRVSVSLDGFETVERRLVVAGGPPVTNDVTLSPARFSQSVVVTARRVEEQAQEVPIPLSVLRGDLVSDAGAHSTSTV